MANLRMRIHDHIIAGWYNGTYYPINFFAPSLGTFSTPDEGICGWRR